MIAAELCRGRLAAGGLISDNRLFPAGFGDI